MANGPGAIGIEDITFVSWNVHVGNGDIDAFVRDLRAVSTPAAGLSATTCSCCRRPCVRPAFHRHDDASGDAHSRGLRRHLPPTSTKSATAWPFIDLRAIHAQRRVTRYPAEDRGNAILSTLPLSEPVAVELPGERQRRVVIIAKAATISLAVVHLDALGGARRLRVFWTPWMRDAQVRYAAAVLPDGPLVIGGDLNTWHGRDEFAAAFSTSRLA